MPPIHSGLSLSFLTFLSLSLSSFFFLQPSNYNVSSSFHRPSLLLLTKWEEIFSSFSSIFPSNSLLAVLPGATSLVDSSLPLCLTLFHHYPLPLSLFLSPSLTILSPSLESTLWFLHDLSRLCSLSIFYSHMCQTKMKHGQERERERMSEWVKKISRKSRTHTKLSNKIRLLERRLWNKNNCPPLRNKSLMMGGGQAGDGLSHVSPLSLTEISWV